MSRSRLLTLSFIFAVAFFSLIAPARAQSGELVLKDVPPYYWTRGCSPTAGMMIMGYWDAYGYSNLIPGSNYWYDNQTVIEDAIASSGHIADYALYDGVNDEDYTTPYIDRSELGGAHADDCLADFMRTSFSSEGLTYGATWTDNIGSGMVNYAAWRGYAFTAGGDYSSTPTWANFTNEINSGRPVVLSVDSDGDGATDHSVTAIGYRDTNGYHEYACRDTWKWGKKWYRFRETSGSYEWGIGGMSTSRPTDPTWMTASSGNWGNAASWDNGVPDSSRFSWVPYGKVVTVSSPAQSARLVSLGTINIAAPLSVQELTNKGTVYHQTGTVQTLGNLGVCGGAEVAAYVQSGGSVQVGEFLNIGTHGTLGRYTLEGGALEASDGISIGSNGRFDWAGGTIKTPKIGSQDTSSHGTFALHFDFNISELASGAIFNGEASIELTELTLGVAGGATATCETGVFQMRSITVGDENSTGTLLIAGNADIDSSIAIKNGLVIQSAGIAGRRPGHTVRLGDLDGFPARYELQGGEVHAEELLVQGSGASVFTQIGGSVYASELYVGRWGSTDCTYELKEGLLWNGTAYIGKELPISAAHFSQTGGTHDAVEVRLYGTYDMTAGNLQLRGSSGLSVRDGIFNQSGGAVSASNVFVGNDYGQRAGKYFLSAGELNISDQLSISDQFGATFDQSGGKVEADRISIGDGSYEMSGGEMIVGAFYLTNGRFEILDSSCTISVSTKFYLSGGEFNAVSGTKIHMTGSALDNYSTDPNKLAGLANLTLIFEGGSGDVDPFEVAGEDMGAMPAGLESNFALDTLRLGAADIGQVQLVNNFDNQPGWVGAEALYVENLILGAGSTLDLNGLNLYYMTFTDNGGTILNGTPTQIPEPATTCLLLLGACLPVLRRHK